MNETGVSFNVVEWDGIVRDVLFGISVLALLFNAYFVARGWRRRTKSGDPSPFPKAAFMTAACVAFLVFFAVTWMLSRALHTAANLGPSPAAISMLLSTVSGYLKAIAISLPSIACGVIGGLGLNVKSSTFRVDTAGSKQETKKE